MKIFSTPLLLFFLLLISNISLQEIQAQQCCASANIAIFLENTNLNVGNDNGSTSEYTWIVTAQDNFGNFGNNNTCYTLDGLPDNTNQTVNFNTNVFNQNYNQTPDCCFGSNSDLPNSLTLEIEAFEDDAGDRCDDGFFDDFGCTVTITITFNWNAGGACGDFVIDFFDECGTRYDYNYSVIVSNNLPTALDPTISGPTSVSCDGNPINLTAATCGGNWSGPGINNNGVFNPTGLACGNYVVTYTGTNCCATQSDTHTITVFDNTPPVAPTPPANVTVQCNTAIPPPVNLTATDNCSPNITVSPTEVNIPGTCQNQFTIVRTWTFSDDCGNESSVTQNISVNDDTPPVAPNPPADITEQCSADIPQ